jgi:hypothetical protein
MPDQDGMPSAGEETFGTWVPCLTHGGARVRPSGPGAWQVADRVATSVTAGHGASGAAIPVILRIDHVSLSQ